MDDHVFSWEEKNEALKKKMQHLERTWVDVNGEVENASKQGDTPYERVTGWMKDVTSLQEEMKKWQACLDEGGLRTDGEKCPNVWKSYQRTKQAEKLLGEVEALNATGDEIIKSAVAIKSIGEAATASSHGYNMQGSQASTDAVLKRRQEAPDLNGKPHSEAVGGSFREAAAESSCDHDVQGSQGGTDAATHSHEAQDLSEVAAGSYGDNDMRGSKDSTQAVNHRQEAQGLKRAMGYAIKCAITKHASRGIHHLRSQCAIHGRPPSTHNGTVRARIRLVRSTLRSTQNFRNRKGDVAESSKGHDTQGSIASKDKEGSTGLEDAEIADTIIGIDLGTTCSCVGVYKDGHIKIIADDQGNCFTPSCVAFTDSGRLIGEAAKNQATMNAERTIFNVKRLIGRKFEDEEVQRDMKLVPYKIVNKDGKPYIQVKVRDGEIKVFSPQEITAMVLTKMKEISEAFLGKKIKDAVISVPVHFNFAQRQATKDAAIIAGLNVRRIINEPTAAALAYRLPVKGGTEKILVFDLGGGTLDVSILTLIGSDHFYVDATSGDIHLGGEDFGQRVMEYFIKLIKEKHGKDISADNCALGKLRSECERAKRILSSEHQVTVEIKSLYDGMDFSEPLTRDQFEELNGDLFRKIKMRVKKALKEAECEKHEIVEIVLVGGSTRIPKVQQLLKDYFDGKEPNRRVNPDEAVTYGAAALGGSLKGRGGDETEGIRLTERLSFQLRFESKCGTVSRFAVKSSSIPWKTYAKFTTTEDQQTIVPIKVFEGEGTCLKDCRCLGEFNLTGIQPAPRGATEIEITFHLDSNGIPDATAEVVDTEESITVTSNFGGLSQEEIKRMVREAKEFAEEDKKVKENIDARSQLETYIYDTKNTINDRDKLADKLKSEEKENVEAALKDVLQWLDDNRNPRKEDYDEKLKEVKAICDPIVSAVYQRSGCGPGGSPHDALALNGA